MCASSMMEEKNSHNYTAVKVIASLLKIHLIPKGGKKNRKKTLLTETNNKEASKVAFTERACSTCLL